MRHPLLSLLERDPVIPAIKDERQIPVQAPADMVFLLCGDICCIDGLIARIHENGKKVAVHADLVNGLAPKEIAADFLLRCGADGVISTRPALIRRGQELGMLTVMRAFAIDSKAVRSLARESALVSPDLIEILPGALPRVIEALSEELPMPLIAGGLIRDKADITAALSAGAMCVSTSDERLWSL